MADAKQQRKPFFLHYNSQAVHIPHTPRSFSWGRRVFNTTASRHLDMAVELDMQVGLLHGSMSGSDLFIFTSDNGGLGLSRDVGHSSQGPIDSGVKGSALEGGHKIPLIVSWPNGPFKTGVFPQLASQLDLFELFRVMLDLPFDAEQGRDSAPGLYRVLVEGPEARPHRNLLLTQAKCPGSIRPTPTALKAARGAAADAAAEEGQAAVDGLLVSYDTEAYVAAVEVVHT